MSSWYVTIYVWNIYDGQIEILFMESMVQSWLLV
jgi:hypothetical protein